MPVVVGIRFKDSGKVYFFDPNGLAPLVQGEQVIVDTVRGPELAKVAYPSYDVSIDDVVGELKPVLRRAELADLERLKTLNARQSELLEQCIQKVSEHNLPMRLVKAEYSFDGSRLTFYFTAEKRVDFRVLVRDLARLFRTRIELRQIGPRDEAKLLGGIGPCGRLLCCATFLPDYARVSIKMAKDQDLPLNPTKISGVCGRLLCCLAYEHEQYVQIKAELPRRGTWVQTPDGPGEVVNVNVLKETIIVELVGSQMQEAYSLEQISIATDQVAATARSRTEEGISPAARFGDTINQQRQQGRRPESVRPERPVSDRKLLRETIDNPEMLEALALLEDDDYTDSLSSNLAPEPPKPEVKRRAPITQPLSLPQDEQATQGSQSTQGSQAAPTSPHEHRPAPRRRRRGRGYDG